MAKKTTKRPKTQRVRSKTTYGKVRLGGYLQGKDTYLHLRVDTTEGSTVDLIQGASLYRLAKAIVRRFEAAQ